jgi:hypothetical protein
MTPIAWKLVDAPPPDLFNIVWPKPQGFPEPREEISEAQYRQELHNQSHQPRALGYDQLIEHPERPGFSDLWVCHITWGRRNAWMEAERDKVIRYFRLGCQHQKMGHLTYTMHDHEERCPDCHYSFRYDSSG